MSFDGENNKKLAADETVEEFPAISTQEIPPQPREHLQEILDECEDADDDEFGDFEEAAPVRTSTQQAMEANEIDPLSSELSRPSCSRIISCDSQTHGGVVETINKNTETYRIKSVGKTCGGEQCNISDVISDSNLWVFDELVPKAEATISEHSDSVAPVMVELEVCDIFRKFDLCGDDSRERECLKTFEIESLRLWTLLCYVEETAALKFLWNKSFSYTLFLDALQMNVKGISISDPLVNSLPSYYQSYSSSDHSAYLASSANTSAEVASESFAPNSFKHSLLPDASIDSLSVAPADFDWKTSGLMNPLTGASIGALSAVLECDFFNSETNSNGQSILERDLKDLGLSNGHLPFHSSSSTNLINKSLPVNLNQLMKNGQPTSNEASSNTTSSLSKQYKRVGELSLQAQALHNRLPDHTYMLSSHLMFPLNNHQQQEQ